MEEPLFSIINNMEIQVYWMALKMALFFIAIFMAKNKLSDIASYLALRLNIYISIGTEIKIQGVEGNIKEINTSKVIIYSKNNSRLVVPIREFTNSTWEILNYEKK
jgi:hypothetical protein